MRLQVHFCAKINPTDNGIRKDEQYFSLEMKDIKNFNRQQMLTESSNFSSETVNKIYIFFIIFIYRRSSQNA